MTVNLLPDVKAMTYWIGKKNSKENQIVEGEGEEAKLVVKETGLVALKPGLTADAAKMMFDASCNLIVTAKAKADANLMKKWFGTRIVADNVIEKLDLLIDFLKTTSLNVRFSREKLESLGAFDPDFFPRKTSQLGKPLLYTRYSWGEKVMTFLHELSHVVLGTHDRGEKGTKIPLPAEAGGACYGPYAVKLAKGDLLGTYGLGQADAFNNAENWGYYIVSHHTQVLATVEHTRADLLGYPDEYTRLDDQSLSNMVKYLKDRDPKPAPSVGMNKGEYYGVEGADRKYFDARITAPPD